MLAAIGASLHGLVRAASARENARLDWQLCDIGLLDPLNAVSDRCGGHENDVSFAVPENVVVNKNVHSCESCKLEIQRQKDGPPEALLVQPE